MPPPKHIRIGRDDLERALRAWDAESRADPDRFLTPEEYGDNALTPDEISATVAYVWEKLGGG